MVRTRPPRRLHDILDAALEVFSRLGYRRARMHDIAAEAGVSPGLLYAYAEGKEALFALVVQREIGTDVDALTLPIANPVDEPIESIVTKSLRTRMQHSALAAAERTPDADVRAELERIVAEHYDAVARARRLLRLIERSALDWPELAESFFERTRKTYVQRLGRYIAQRVDSGAFRPVPDPDVAARFIVETVAWFANHRFGDHDGAQIDDALARATVVELVTNSLVAP
jgi:AcrR family transcriptional regulator